MAVAVNVFSGTADVGLGIMAAAQALGLDFVPLLPERYDLVVPESTFTDPRFQALLAVIRSAEFQEAAMALGGYDLKDCGKLSGRSSALRNFRKRLRRWGGMT